MSSAPAYRWGLAFGLALTGCAHSASFHPVLTVAGWDLLVRGSCYSVAPVHAPSPTKNGSTTCLDGSSPPIDVWQPVSSDGRTIVGGRAAGASTVSVTLDGRVTRGRVTKSWFLVAADPGHSWQVTAFDRRGVTVGSVSGTVA